MTTRTVAVVPTGTANLASVRAAFHRLDARPVDATDADEVAAADRLVLPGVGSFGAAMAAIDDLELREAMQRRIADDRPTLAVCVGMQLLGLSSSESPGVTGLGVVPLAVERFPDDVRVPQLGWNRVGVLDGSRYLTPDWAYFANSYRFPTAPAGWVAATAVHGGPFVAALERGTVLALQFHPELSGRWGAGVLARWLEAS